MVQVTLSAPCIRCESPWLLALSKFQVPAKFGLVWALVDSTMNANAVIIPAVKNNLLIRKILRTVCNSLILASRLIASFGIRDAPRVRRVTDSFSERLL